MTWCGVGFAPASLPQVRNRWPGHRGGTAGLHGETGGVVREEGGSERVPCAGGRSASPTCPQ